MRGGKTIELKKTVDKALEKCPTIKNVFVMKRTTSEFSLNEADILIEEVIDFSD